MDKSMVMGVVIGVGGAIAGGAVASYAVMNNNAEQRTTQTLATQQAQDQAAHNGLVPAAQLVSVVPEPQFAKVVAVDPVTNTTRTPRQKCHTEQVVHRKEVKDTHQVTGTVLGGVLGGALGNQVGKGNGRKVATVAGAIAGGYTGNRVQKNLQDKDTYTTSEQRCTTVTKTHRTTVGYDVTYRWNGALTTVRMKQRPGDRLPIQNGEVKLVSARNLASYE